MEQVILGVSPIAGIYDEDDQMSESLSKRDIFQEYRWSRFIADWQPRQGMPSVRRPVET